MLNMIHVPGAVVEKPLLYDDRVTHGRVAFSILGCWVLAGLTGFLPVFTGIYSDPEHLQHSMMNSAMTCDLVVNKYFSVIAGVISFWVPGMYGTHHCKTLTSNNAMYLNHVNRGISQVR